MHNYILFLTSYTLTTTNVHSATFSTEIIHKCSILSVKRKDPILYDYYIKENTRDMQLERRGKVKDLGVIIDSK